VQRNEPRPDDGHDDDRVVNFLGAWIERDGNDWVVCMLADGTRKVLGRHATEELARAALARLNESPTSTS
jgi:hypothetical protein